MPTLESAPQAVPTFMLSQNRVIRAPRSRVYEAWTNPEILKQWFGPDNMYCPEAMLDVRVGGEYRIAVLPTAEAAASEATSDSERRHAAAVGSYTKIAPNELLQFTWSPNWNLGEQSLVTVTFKDVEGGTERDGWDLRVCSESTERPVAVSVQSVVIGMKSLAQPRAVAALSECPVISVARASA